MRALMIILNLLIVVTTFWLLYDKFNEDIPVIIVPIEPKSEPKKTNEIIEEFNKINLQIKNFECRNVDVKMWQNGMRHKISGTLFYEKPNNLRMKIWSFMGEELDLGSNKDIFWYWSRRDRDPGIH